MDIRSVCGNTYDKNFTIRGSDGSESAHDRVG